MGSYLTEELALLRGHIEQLNKMFQALPIVDIKKSKSLVSILKLDESKSRHPVGILSSDDYIAVRQRLNESANLFNKISSLCKLLSEEKDKENDPGTADISEATARDASASTEDSAQSKSGNADGNAGDGRQEWKDGNKTVMSWRLKSVGTQTEKPGQIAKIGFVPQRLARSEPSAEETTTGDIETKEKIVKQLLYSEEQKDVVIKSELTSQSHEIVVSHDASTNSTQIETSALERAATQAASSSQQFELTKHITPHLSKAKSLAIPTKTGRTVPLDCKEPPRRTYARKIPGLKTGKNIMPYTVQYTNDAGETVTQEVTPENTTDISERAELENSAHNQAVLKVLGRPLTEEEIAQKYVIITKSSFIFEKPIVCILCGASRNNNEEMDTHLRKHYDVKPFQCHLCASGFVTQHNLDRHVETRHEMRFVCTYCKKKFSSERTLQTHIGTFHTGDKPFKCTFCPKSFGNRSTYKEHRRRHIAEKKLKCPFCDKKFHYKHHLVEHERIHTGDKPYECKMCDKAFNKKTNLTNHERSVHLVGDTFYTCGHCQKKFHQKKRLEQHILTHTGEKPFQCHFCSKRFNKECNMKAHMRIHTGEARFKCDLCPKTFDRKKKFETHRETHYTVHHNQSQYTQL